MGRRSNRKRQPAPRRKPQLPAIDWPALMGAISALAVVAAVYVSTVWLMNRPIQQVVINGRFERVSALQLQEALGDLMHTGFLSADLRAIRERATAIPWVASARVRRRWPGIIEVTVSEEQPAARWGEAGLLNTAGELFLDAASHLPAELPQLDGPPGTEAQVAARFFAVERRLEQRGLSAVSMRLDARGAWEFRLNNGVIVRLGSAAVATRLERFFDALDQVLAGQTELLRYVDLRYPNGFAVGWNESRSAAAQTGEGADPDV